MLTREQIETEISELEDAVVSFESKRSEYMESQQYAAADVMLAGVIKRRACIETLRSVLRGDTFIRARI